jgi:hypothetical protein
MLAYFFYHWKQPSVSELDYEQRLRAFHDALKASPSVGFSTSWSFALRGPVWANDGGDSYEDWYLVRNSADLDPLNDAAISASRKVPHDKAAAALAGGAAGLYRPRLGEVIDVPKFTTWFAKPDGWSYQQLFDRLGPTLERGGALWQRQMALGPGEFCLHTNASISVPSGLDARVVPLRSVFPAGA